MAKIKKIICDKCKFEISAQNYKRHIHTCNGNGPYYKNNKFENRVDWIKGKTYKEVYGSERSIDIINKIKKSKLNNPQPKYYHTNKSKENISKKMLGNTNWKNSINKSGKGKKGYYKGYYFMSSWELAYIIFNLEHNIQFERNWNSFKYLDENNIERKYIPDFYIKKDNSFIEIKGYDSIRFQYKLKYFPHKIQVFYKNEMTYILNYVSLKYGVNFVDVLTEQCKRKKLKITRDEYLLNKKEKYKLSQQKYIEIVLNSNIDFSKFGWVGKVANLINKKPQNINEWIKIMMPDFYESKCFKVKRK